MNTNTLERPASGISALLTGAMGGQPAPVELPPGAPRAWAAGRPSLPAGRPQRACYWPHCPLPAGVGRYCRVHRTKILDEGLDR